MEKTLTSYAIEPDGTVWARDMVTCLEWEVIRDRDTLLIIEGTPIDHAIAKIKANHIPIDEFMDEIGK